MHNQQQMYSISLAALLLLLPIPIQAEADTTQGENDRQQLQSVLKELDQAAKDRQAKSSRVEELSHRLDCNWTLIRSYEVCGQLHKNDPDAHLLCSKTAKQKAANCLETNKSD